jgi:hypothetical protein
VDGHLLRTGPEEAGGNASAHHQSLGKRLQEIEHLLPSVMHASLTWRALQPELQHSYWVEMGAWKIDVMRLSKSGRGY